MFTKKPSTIISKTISEIKKPEVKKPLPVPEVKNPLQEVKKDESKKRIIFEGCPFKSAKQLIVNRLLGRAMSDDEISKELKIWFPEIKNGGSIPHYRSHLNSGTRYLPDGMTKIEPKLIKVKDVIKVNKPEVNKPKVNKPPTLQKEYREEKVGDVIINKGFKKIKK